MGIVWGGVDLEVVHQGCIWVDESILFGPADIFPPVNYLGARDV